MTLGATATPVSTRRSILLLSFATFSSMTSQRICDAMLPELSREFTVSLGRAAQVISVFAVVYGLSQLFYGPLGDRIGKYRVVTFATLACALGSGVCAFAGSLDALVVARMLVAAGAAAIIPLSMAWVGDSVATEQLQETLARLGLGSTFGIVGGQLLGGFLTDAVGWRWAFGFMAVLFGCVGTLLYFNWRKQPPMSASGGHAVSAGNTSFLRQSLSMLTTPWPRTVLAVALLEGAAGFGVLAIWASHLHTTHQLSLSMAGSIVALFGLGGVLYMSVARHLIHRFGQVGLCLMGGSLVGISELVLGLAPDWYWSIPAGLFGGFGFFMFHNTMQANATQMTPKTRGTAVSLFACALFIGQSLGVMAAAALIAPLGSGVVVALGGGTITALGAYFAYALRRREKHLHPLLT
jgi:predicted MFS family arabinose efflux permease